MAKQLRSLSGRVVAITGGARGIGRATAAALAAQGARVAIGDLDAELTRKVAADLGPGVLGVELDVTDRDSFSSFLDRVIAEFGSLDVLVNNAGIVPAGDFADEADAVTARVIDVNLGGTLLGCKLALARMLPRGEGQIVNISSGLGRTPAAGTVSYCASKYAVAGLTDALRAELGGSGVELHLILPSLTATDMAAGAKRLRGMRLVKPERVAAAIVEALQTGRREVYLPRRLGWLIGLQAITPPRLVSALRRMLGVDRMFTRVDPLARAAYEARIAPPVAPPAPDPAATVARAAASVADALNGGAEAGFAGHQSHE